MRFIQLQALAASVCISSSLLHARPPATADEVKALAERIPVLTAPSADCPPFIARGAMPHLDEAYEYEIVWNGKDYRAAMLDPDDGTPLMITDHQTMLTCDVYGGRPFVTSFARFAVTVRSDPDGPGTVTGHPWYVLREPTGLPTSEFDIRESVRGAADHSTIETLEDGSIRLTQQVTADQTRVVQFAAPPSRNVRFGNVSRRQARYTSYHELLLDGVDVKSAALRMPDVLTVMNSQPIDYKNLVRDGRFQMAGHLGQFRRAIRGDAEARKLFADDELTPARWTALAERDAKMVGVWQKTLEDLHVVFERPAAPWRATTQPTSGPATGPTGASQGK